MELKYSLEKYELLYAFLNDIAFVNFHEVELIGPECGDKDLFNKIHNFETIDYKYFSKLNIEEEVKD